ncbi:hypothetical protein Ancab_028866 [Ancistrocladus abbreviatus]
MDVWVPSLSVVMEVAYQLFAVAFIALIFSFFLANANLLSGAADTGDLSMVKRSKASDKSGKKREQRAGVVEDGRFADLFPVQGFSRKTKRVKFVDDSLRVFQFKAEELVVKNIGTQGRNAEFVDEGGELSESRDDGVPTCKLMVTDVNLEDYSFPGTSDVGEEANVMCLVRKDKVGWLDGFLLEERAVKEGFACEIEGFNSGISGGVGLEELSEEERRENVDAEVGCLVLGNDNAVNRKRDSGIVAEGEIEREENTGDRNGSRDFDVLELGVANDVAYHDEQGRIMEFEESELKEKSKDREVGIGADLGSQKKEVRIVSIEEIERDGRIWFREGDDDCIELDTANDVADHDGKGSIMENEENELKEKSEDRGIDEIGSEAEGASLNLASGIVVGKTQVRIGSSEEIERVEQIGDREGDGDVLELGIANDAVGHDRQGRFVEFEKSECKEESEDREVDEMGSESDGQKKGIVIVGIEEKERKDSREGDDCMELAFDGEFVCETRQWAILECNQVELKERSEDKGSHEDGMGLANDEVVGDVGKEFMAVLSEEIVDSVNEEREIGEKNDAGAVINDDEEWEGIERTELEKRFAKATNFIEYGDKEGQLAKVGSNVIMQLYGLHKVAIQGPCHGPQPMALMLSARAKWNAWKRLGSMSPEEAMEQYIALLSDNVPGWMDDNSSVEEKFNSSVTGMQNLPKTDLSTSLTDELISACERTKNEAASHYCFCTRTQ